MEAPVLELDTEVIEINRWDEEELDLLAFELWQRACCPDKPADENWLEPEARGHASCL